LLEAVLRFEGSRRVLRALEVVVDRCLRAVLADQVHNNMHVVVPVRRHAVPHCHPTAWSLGALVVVEPHRLDEVAGDRTPLLVGQQTFLGAQRQ